MAVPRRPHEKPKRRKTGISGFFSDVNPLGFKLVRRRKAKKRSSRLKP